ncbi:MAG: zinc finger, UBP-type [Mycobacterium sp.]|jgi:CPA1 family monovalent cation:H+ antiporter|nr:zinc finger, UBP-type [Mycobacterium sp.]
MNGWHETWNDQPGSRAVICGHLETIAVPPAPADPPAACKECLLEGTKWVELRRCLVCGHTGCCESSPRRHADAHFAASGHAVIANQSGGQPWGWCYVDEFSLLPDEAPGPV